MVTWVTAVSGRVLTWRPAASENAAVVATGDEIPIAASRYPYSP